MTPSTNPPATAKTTPLVRLTGRVSSGVLALGLTLAACGGQTDVIADQATRQAADASDPVTEVIEERAVAESVNEDPPSPVEAEPEADMELSTLASQVVALPQAFPEIALDGLGDPVGDTPRAINLPSLGISNAPIVPVGLEANGELEVPGADAVGWYEFGVGIDGGRGSAVLAAHIAYNGQDGVFRDLIDLVPGERITVERDGEPVEYTIETVVDYDKYELPIDDFFSESGEERVILITCGGSFNPELASYEDNTVAIAVPV